MGISLDRNALQPATSCELAWRWTQTTHSLLTPVELSEIACIPRDAAVALDERSRLAQGRDGLLSPPVSDVRALDVGDPPDRERVSSWLRSLPTGGEHEVVSSWSRDTAILLPWAVFLLRWEDFCYPASDDVAVFPLSEAWVLGYHHENVFQWGRWRAA
jgi:hypothetical protein